ncbi:TlpA family protein disulfide reductase [Algibacter luteus]|uniref:Thiol-disulfide isomerase or thioredoxin n=1 Tax=Algibacter luteus TaxID=1178825 RepID=A0A1M6FCP6_9FLAO|nr:TlpA disulfide reductase family protein [Algibacter luteus]SHI95423.1 Thiol-disulfide isomerase or thioredoxin [Algibacter luteus]
MRNLLILLLIFFLSCQEVEKTPLKKIVVDTNEIVNSKKTNKKELIGEKFIFHDIKTLADKKVNSEILIGKPTLIIAWSITCKSCIEEIPILNELVTKYSDKVNFIAITNNSKKEIRRFIRKREFNFTHIINAKEIHNDYNIYSFPKTFLLDKNGIITKTNIRGITYKKINGKFVKRNENGEEFVRLIDKLL